jgi:hypothetical protein
MNCHPERSEGPALSRAMLAAIIALTSLFAAQAQVKTTPTVKARNDDPQLYRNDTFGFRFQIPYTWVDRTKEMRATAEAGKSELLLAIFQRPPEATGNTINSAVVIASESAAAYPGLKKVEDYLDPLTELATAKGFKAEGEASTLEEESRHLLRADFSKPLGDKLNMRQCTLAMLMKGQIVSFTFIAGSEDELNDLMDGLHFGATKPPAH